MPNSPKHTRKAAPKTVSPTSAKGKTKTRGQADVPDRPDEALAAAAATVEISPTLLAAFITRSITRTMEPLIAELRDIARTSHDTSDRLVGAEFFARAQEQQRAKQDETGRLQGLLDKLWAQGYRPTSTAAPMTVRSFHEFEEYVGVSTSGLR